MKPLLKETKAVAALLVAGADTPEALANSVIQAMDEMRGERTTHMAVLRFGQGETTFYAGLGPYSTKNQAIKAVEKYPASSEATALAVVPVRSAEGVEQLLAELDGPANQSGDWTVVAQDRAAFKNGWKGKSATRDNYLGERS